MKYNFVRYLLLALLAAFLLSGTITAVPAAAQGPDGVVITNPGEGQTVSDVVVVTGAIAFSDFLKYDFFLKNGDNMIWVATGYSPVINGNILRLDTKTFADSTYQIVVRKVTSDSNYTDVVGPAFTVQNGLTAPNPYPEVEATFLYPAPGKATVRVRNCTGEDFFADYTSPQGFRSSGEITLKPWSGEGPCPYADIALIPGEYRGTAKGGAQVRGLNYTLNGEAGKVYEMTYNGPAAGAAALYIAEIEPDERASSDTGGLDASDPARAQTEAELQAGAMAAGESTDGKMATETMKQPASDSSAQAVLPVSGQAAPTTAPFAIAAVGLIVLMVVGGLFAIKRGKQTA